MRLITKLKIFTSFITFVILLFLTHNLLEADVTDFKILPSASQKQLNLRHINILDVKQLHFSGVNELSGLAYKNNKLYAIGDGGILYRFSLDIQNKKIAHLSLDYAKELRDKHNKKLSKKMSDSEGLAFYKKNLLISFEGENRVDLYSLNAKKIKSIKINKKLLKYSDYDGKNKGLESVAYSKKYGVLTAPEVPLKKKKIHIIYAKDRVWHFKAKGVISDMTFISKNKLLILLKEFHLFTMHRISRVVLLNLKKCKYGSCKAKIIHEFDSKDGWRLDNFEGITKVKNNLFLVVSDNNHNPFQKTLLVLFELNL